MGLLEEGLARIEARQLQRLADANRDRQDYKFATYQGKNLVDGTDIIDNGATTSGFKVMSNAALSKGDRVSLRPNQQGGLQRVDAQNIPPDVVIEDKKIDLIFASLGYVGISGVGGTDKDLFFNGTDNLATGGLMQYRYDTKSRQFRGKGKFNLAKNTNIPPNPNNAEFSFNFVGENNSVTYAFDSFFAQFAVFFPKNIWKRKFENWLGYYSNANFYDAPIEVEMSLNGVTQSPSLLIDLTVDESFYYIAPDCVLSPSQSPVTFIFRWKARGNENWFSL